MDERGPTEHEEQREFVRWFRSKWPHIKIFAIPNGGARNKIVAAKLKAEGVSKGVPDLCVPEFNLWIEMKRKKGGRLTAEQKRYKEYLESIGNVVIVGFGAIDAKIKTESYIYSIRKK